MSEPHPAVESTKATYDGMDYLLVCGWKVRRIDRPAAAYPYSGSTFHVLRPFPVLNGRMIYTPHGAHYLTLDEAVAHAVAASLLDEPDR